MTDAYQPWPPLPLAAWRETRETLHLWSQIVGKILLHQTPLVNHWWNAAFHLTSRGWTTGPVPHGRLTFEIEFDFVDHRLRITASDGGQRALPLEPRTVADFHVLLLETLRTMGLAVKPPVRPDEIPDAVPFAEDRQHGAYDPDFARRHWEVLTHSARVLQEFRGRFLGKCSPVHFFWGSFDLCVTRFSGRRAPARPDADAITREAYSHEVLSAGFWPGGGAVDDASYYAYAAPWPPGLEHEFIRPAGARYDPALGEFLLPYEMVRRSASPERVLLDFLESTYAAGARLLNWDRAALERVE